MKPTLLVLAAGMGSRYGGLKQIDPVGPHGETIIDYSIYDALRAGFGKLVFVIRKDLETQFKEIVGARFEKRVPVEYVFQELDKLPAGFTVHKKLERGRERRKTMFANPDEATIDWVLSHTRSYDYYANGARLGNWDFPRPAPCIAACHGVRQRPWRFVKRSSRSICCWYDTARMRPSICPPRAAGSC